MYEVISASVPKLPQGDHQTAFEELCLKGWEKPIDAFFRLRTLISINHYLPDGATLIHKVCELGHLEVVKKLRENGDALSYTDILGENALHKAVRSGDYYVVNWITLEAPRLHQKKVKQVKRPFTWRAHLNKKTPSGPYL